MLPKLALRNIARSLRDYTIYFITLMFGVCLFYMFNSVDSQTAMLNLSKSKMETVRTLMKAIDYISVFVSVVLGFLVIYANRFLIRRRKKEFGVYMTLGMPKGNLSGMIVLETFLIGTLSLAVGLAVGIFASQGMSILTAKLFETNLISFRFIYSRSAFDKTVLYFIVIFLVVIIFNTVSISRLKLIRLLNGSRENENINIHNPKISIVTFILAVAILVMAYVLIIRNGIQPNAQFAESIILGCVGTLLFFFSLSGFLVKAAQRSKHYWKDLNVFVLRQFSSKINTTFVSVSVICLMLFLTISALAVGVGVTNTLSKDLRFNTPYDLSFWDSGNDTENGTQATSAVNIEEFLSKSGIDLSRWAADSAQILEYSLKSDSNNKASIPILQGDYQSYQWQGQEVEFDQNQVNVISISDYNRAMRVQGKPGVTLPEGKFLINCNAQQFIPAFNSFLSNGGKLVFHGKTLSAGAPEILDHCLTNAEGRVDCGTMIVPDSFLLGLNLQPTDVSLNIRYKTGADEEELLNAFDKIQLSNDESHAWGYRSKKVLYEETAGDKTLASYMTLYFGVVFLIAAAAVLALQQLSESSDNADRYSLLRKLGADDDMVNRSLLKQISLYFLLPLLLAAVHSTVAIYVVNSKLLAGGLDISSGVIAVLVIFIIVYGAYFLATYFGSKNMVRLKDISRRLE